MEFRIQTTGRAVELDTITNKLRIVDPASVVDMDDSGATLRIAAAVSAAELVVLLDQSGYPVDPRQIQQSPSICCGGCGG